MYEARIAAFVVASLLLHWLLFDGLDRLPEQQKTAKQVVMFQVTQPPPPPPTPEPPPPEPKVPDELTPQPEPPKIPPKTPPRESTAKPRPPSPIDHPPPPDTPPKDVQPSERTPTPGATGDEPVFGIDMASTSDAGAGPALPVGNQLQTGSDGTAKDPKKVKPLAPSLPPPVAAHEVEKAPEMVDQDQCKAPYTDEARQAAAQGVVVLDLVVGEDGKAREIEVVKSLGYGLDQAAIEALRRCPFRPGLRGGQPVPVRIRAFKVRFYPHDEE